VCFFFIGLFVSIKGSQMLWREKPARNEPDGYQDRNKERKENAQDTRLDHPQNSQADKLSGSKFVDRP
jgi:hypothetical protein